MSVIQTYTGVQFDVLSPKRSMVRIDDIAHALSMLCRFTGHVQKFYSVAEHCVWVSRMVPPEYALAGLLHDASEAYVSDIASPVKQTMEMAQYRRIENRLHAIILSTFGLPIDLPPEVSEVDLRMAATEAQDLMRPIPTWVWKCNPYQFEVHGWEPCHAEEQYMRRFLELYQERAEAVA